MNRWWNERNPRERAMLAICASMIIVVAVWVGLTPSEQHGPKLLPYAEARRDYDTALHDKQAMEKEADRLAPEIKRLTFAGGPDAAVPDAVRQLQKCAAASGLHIREMKPLRARKVGALYHAPISVRFSSSHFDQDAVPFLYRVEDPAGKLVVEKMNLSAPDTKSAAVDVELQVAVYTVGAPAGSQEDVRQ